MKTSELTDRALDWAVAKALGFKLYGKHDFLRRRLEYLKRHNMAAMDAEESLAFMLESEPDHQIIGYIESGETRAVPRYTTDWAWGGPIIERERIFVKPKTASQDWRSYVLPISGDGIKFSQHGPTPLVAALRCFVQSRLGDEVDIPEELL